MERVSAIHKTLCRVTRQQVTARAREAGLATLVTQMLTNA